MNGNKLLGFVLLAAGAAVAFFGINRSNSFISQMGGALGQTDATAVGAMVLGALLALGGVMLLAKA
ncbi:MAG TPA: DUF3185 family protein [Burkholderiales bacterium]|jgi:hypothetical protein|nr:DUF3185 family protein [Burkholderiales bacterium]